MRNLKISTKLILLAFIPLALVIIILATALLFIGGNEETVALNVNIVRELILWFAILAIVVGVFSLWLIKGIVSPMSQVYTFVEEICKNWNLNKSIPVLSDSTADHIAKAINLMLDKFCHVVSQIGHADNGLLQYSDKLSTITTSELEALQRQQQEIQHVASATNQMTSTIQDIAKNASQAANAAKLAGDEADKGDALVIRTLDSINQLAEEVNKAREVIQRVDADSKEIGSVLDVIKGIAEQTNLLALNAAIEAARAGEQGRGFAVVADEVRTLAQRTQQSTQEIQNMIERLQSGAGKAVAVMKEGTSRSQANVEEASKAGESLQAIKQAIALINKMNIQIASVTGEQTAVAEEINTNLNSITEVSAKSASSAEETSQISTEISNIAVILKNMATNFVVE